MILFFSILRVARAKKKAITIPPCAGDYNPNGGTTLLVRDQAQPLQGRHHRGSPARALRLFALNGSTRFDSVYRLHAEITSSSRRRTADVKLRHNDFICQAYYDIQYTEWFASASYIP